MNSEIALWMKTPDGKQRLSIFQINENKGKGYGQYLKGLVKAFGDITAEIENSDILPIDGIYFLGVDGSDQVYDKRFAKTVPYRLKSAEPTKESCTSTLRNIMAYLLLRETENIIAAEKGERSERGAV